MPPAPRPRARGPVRLALAVACAVVVAGGSVAGCSTRPTTEQLEQQQIDASRLSLVEGAIDDGPTPPGPPTTAEGGGAVIIRADRPLADLRLAGVPPGRYAVRALCLGRGTVRVTVRAAHPTAAAAAGITARVHCGDSETFFGRDIATGVLAQPGLAVSMVVIGRSDGAIAYRVRGY